MVADGPSLCRLQVIGVDSKGELVLTKTPAIADTECLQAIATAPSRVPAAPHLPRTQVGANGNRSGSIRADADGDTVDLP